MSRSAKLNISLMVAALVMWTGVAAADPLLTKPQIAKAAAKIEACVVRREQAGKPSTTCIGLIKAPCDDAISAGGEAAHATCSDNETAAWDVLLNKQWAMLSSNMEVERFAALKAVQKLWLSYRDAKCTFVKGDGSDMMAYMNAADCLMDETARRALELREIE